MESNEKNIYELGYLLIPIIAPEKLADEITVLRSAIESNGGLVLLEEGAKEKKLSYEMTKDISGGKKVRYDDAYFGWMKFNLAPDAIVKLEEELKKNATLLRYLIINLSKEGGLSNGTEVKKSAGAKKPKKTVSEKELDKEIDNLLDKTA